MFYGRGCSQITNLLEISCGTRLEKREACLPELVDDASALVNAQTIDHYHHQVSNAGVTSLCEKCPLLAHLGMASLKHVTDIGVARLGAGCTRLTHLDISGFVNLSDGMQRDFAFTGVQVWVLFPVQNLPAFRAWSKAAVPNLDPLRLGRTSLGAWAV